MNQASLRRPAARPSRRASVASGMTCQVDRVVADKRPDDPLHCLRPVAIGESVRAFAAAFPGRLLYAVKCNPEPRVLRALWRAGIRNFDCASSAEVGLVRQMFSNPGIHFMHPVKSRAAIAEAYDRHGVRDFALDSDDELRKILEVVAAIAGRRRREADLGLIVRLAVSNCGAAYSLSGKFGADAQRAAALLAAARPYAQRLGVSFHVGSQCLRPEAYAEAIRVAAQAAERARVAIDIVDVGGGFPVAYTQTTPPPLTAYTDAIRAAVAESSFADTVELWAEPGRALVAAGASLVVRVIHRRDRDLFVNDGIYGSLSDAGTPGFRFPVRLIPRDGRPPAAPGAAFRLFGPTCDAADRMDGPFELPEDAAEGDWIEVGQLGAYGSALRTAFNGFDRARLIEVNDPPLLATPGYGPIASAARATAPAWAAVAAFAES
ncbi:MAG: type III PLP-dependent enzyme [Rhodospirillales bacterium]|nr:type III PLP-dependent enzyme [Rhodospirillales bacterium]